MGKLKDLNLEQGKFYKLKSNSMKKHLILITIFACSLTVSAQKSLMLYEGVKKTDFLSGPGNSSDGLFFVDSLFSGAKDKALYLSDRKSVV